MFFCWFKVELQIWAGVFQRWNLLSRRLLSFERHLPGCYQSRLDIITHTMYSWWVYALLLVCSFVRSSPTKAFYLYIINRSVNVCSCSHLYHTHTSLEKQHQLCGKKCSPPVWCQLDLFIGHVPSAWCGHEEVTQAGSSHHEGYDWHMTPAPPQAAH